MSFKNRDDHLVSRVQNGELSEGKLEEILIIVDSTPEPTKTVLSYIGDITSLALLYELNEQQYVFGGYAVLSHLVSRFGDQIIPIWRGSDDIDMKGTIEVLNALRSAYAVKNDRESPNLENKITLKLGSKDDVSVCKIDYVFMNNGDDSEDKVETIYVLGIPLRVATPLSLIQAKLELAEKEETHYLDVLHMVGVLEHRGTEPEAVAQGLNRKQREKLYEQVKRYSDRKAERIDLGPSGDYIKSLKDKLRRS